MPGKSAGRLFLFTLIFSPLAFGAVEPWSIAIMESGAAAALCFYLLSLSASGRPLYRIPGLVPLTLLLIYLLLQTTPLPAQLVQLISPAAFEIQARVQSPPAWMTLTIHPQATLNEFFRYLSYALFYVLTIQLLSEKMNFRRVLLVVSLFSGILAFSSILQLYLTEDMALWFRHVPKNSMIVGPYICHNHYAGLMAMALPLVLGLFLFHRPRLRQGSLIRGVVEILSQEKANIHILIGTIALLMAVSIILSLSRGGMISSALSLLVFLVLLSRSRVSRKGPLLIAGLLLLIGLAVSWFGWDPIVERFVHLTQAAQRVDLARLHFWRDSLGIVKTFPVSGSGFGTFADIYPAYQTLSEKYFVAHTHNDYLELLIEGGVIGLGLLLCFIGSVLHSSWKTLKTRKDRYALYLGCGALSGVSALLFHGFFDFNLHIGANGLWFFFLLGLAVSAAHTSFQPQAQTSRLARLDIGRSRTFAIAGSGLILVLVLFSGITQTLGDFYYSAIEDYTISLTTPAEELQQMRNTARQAAFFAPLNALYVFAQGDTSWLLHDQPAAARHFHRAICLNPTKAAFLKRYGLFLARHGDKDQALEYLRLSVVYHPVNSDNKLEYGALLLSRGQRDQGIDYLKQAAFLNHKLVSKILTTLTIEGFSVDQMAAVIPETPEVIHTFAGFLDSLGQSSAADAQYLRAVAAMTAERKNRRLIHLIQQRFVKQGNMADALTVLKRGEELLPEDADFRMFIGDIYLRQGLLFKARDKYEQALLLNPGHQGLKKRLSAPSF